ncbi:Uncharacterized protein dnm_018060 [Desulfonema magnum]|uniref:Uncharacterized protein n=1 Tax=Desulfonema magnum TaxID=45655 RepID=A0A975BI40_9BACT|nr:Uncharacterized protein dnm_018060 [Desulfonema magnum]
MLSVRKNCKTFILRCDRQIMAVYMNREPRDMTVCLITFS